MDPPASYHLFTTMNTNTEVWIAGMTNRADVERDGVSALAVLPSPSHSASGVGDSPGRTACAKSGIESSVSKWQRLPDVVLDRSDAEVTESAEVAIYN
jgi:hypothetical protein